MITLFCLYNHIILMLQTLGAGFVLQHQQHLFHSLSVESGTRDQSMLLINKSKAHVLEKEITSPLLSQHDIYSTC